MRETIAEALGSPGLTVLELRTDRDRNVELHRELWVRVGAALRAQLTAGGVGS
jgi:2-succinyl-5-enolpyruvyl-6-hydroxy-3-cyclohexene-1-carboxylate synthase